ncbi:MAG: helix-turn-helix domain-containing protein [Patescibacteria group bacterium]
MVTPNEYLTQLGLSNKQIKIYLDLSAYPESTVVQIYKRIQEPRSSIYLELECLIGDGFVISKKVDKSTFYKITNPKILELTLEEKTKKLQFLTENLKNFTTSIKESEVVKDSQKTINIYKGQAGIKQLLWNILLSKADLVIGFSPGKLEDITDRSFSEKWREKFRELKMHNKIIFNKPIPLDWSEIPGFLEENVEAKTLDEKKIKFDRMMLIYKDTLTVCSLKTDSDQYGIEIKDDLLVNSQIQLFDFLWNHVAKTLK